MLVYISLIGYLIDCKDHVLSKNHTDWTLYVSPVVCGSYREGAANRISIHGSASSTYFPCMLYLRTRSLNNLRILSMIAFTFRLTVVCGFVLIPHYSSTKLFLNLWLRNYPPWSYIISTGQGYLTSHSVYTKFLIVIALLLLYCVISHHPVTECIIITYFKIKGYSLFLRILYVL